MVVVCWFVVFSSRACRSRTSLGRWACPGSARTAGSLGSTPRARRDWSIGRHIGRTYATTKSRLGYDYVHSVVDDHSRFAYSEILPDEQAATCSAFFARALTHLAEHGIHIDAVMTDNHWSYTKSRSLAGLLASAQINHVLIKPHCPWQNGKVERYHRTLQTEWAYRQVFTSNADRADALAPWLEDYNTQRRHSALGGRPPISRLSPT